jgi:hypothetical protein
MVSPEIVMLSVFITPWMKPTFIHCATSAAWRSRHRAQQRQVRFGRAASAGVVAGDRVVGELAQLRRLAARGEELEGAHAQVAGGHARQHGAGQRPLAAPGSPVATAASARVVGMPSACIASPIRYLAQHRAPARLAVAAARERRAARALEGDVAAPALAVDHLAQQQRAAVAQLRREAAELVAGVGLGDRLGAGGHAVAGEQRGARHRGRQGVGVQAQLVASAWFS